MGAGQIDGPHQRAGCALGAQQGRWAARRWPSLKALQALTGPASPCKGPAGSAHPACKPCRHCRPCRPRRPCRPAGPAGPARPASAVGPAVPAGPTGPASRSGHADSAPLAGVATVLAAVAAPASRMWACSRTGPAGAYVWTVLPPHCGENGSQTDACRRRRACKHLFAKRSPPSAEGARWAILRHAHTGALERRWSSPCPHTSAGGAHSAPLALVRRHGGDQRRQGPCRACRPGKPAGSAGPAGSAVPAGAAMPACSADHGATSPRKILICTFKDQATKAADAEGGDDGAPTASVHGSNGSSKNVAHHRWGKAAEMYT